MKLKLFAFAVALAAATAFLLLSVRPWEDPTDLAAGADEPTTTAVPVTPQPTSTAADAPPAITTTPPPSVTTAPGAPGATDASGTTVLRAVVTRFADGDSFEVDWVDPPPSDLGRAEVRMLGINAPEARSCFGSQARTALQDLINGRTITVEIIETENGGFGRQISNVWVGDDLVNLHMVEVGAALALTGDGAFADLITEAQDAARAQGLGLWTACAATSDIAILDLWADAPGRDDFNPNGEWIDIGNTGAVAVDVSGWGIRDESTRHRFTFPDGLVLQPGERVRIGSGCEWHDGDDRNDGPPDIFWCASDPVWNNSGDTAFLIDGDGRFVDQWSYAN